MKPCREQLKYFENQIIEYNVKINTAKKKIKMLKEQIAEIDNSKKNE